MIAWVTGFYDNADIECAKEIRNTRWSPQGTMNGILRQLKSKTKNKWHEIPVIVVILSYRVVDTLDQKQPPPSIPLFIYYIN